MFWWIWLVEMHKAAYFCVPCCKVDSKRSLTYYLQFSDKNILGRENMSSMMFCTLVEIWRNSENFTISMISWRSVQNLNVFPFAVLSVYMYRTVILWVFYVGVKLGLSCWGKRTQTEGAWENTWGCESWSNRRVVKTVWWGALWFVFLTIYCCSDQ